MADDFTLAGEGALWIQPDGPNTKPIYLGCHELGGITIPKGDLTILYKPGTSPNQFLRAGSFRGAPGTPTTSIVTDVKKVRDELQKVSDCPCGLYFMKVSCGKKNVFANYDLGIGTPGVITSHAIEKFAVSDPANQDRTKQTFDISLTDPAWFYQLKAAQVTTPQTEALLDVIPFGDDICAGDCGDTSVFGDEVYGAGGVVAGSPGDSAEMLYTVDRGVNWSIAAAHPFAATESIRSIQAVFFGRGLTRVIAARGTTDVSHPAEVGLSDDAGDTWTNVNVGSVNGQYAIGSRALFALDAYHIWLCTDGGYVYKSEDAGASWTAQTTGDVTSEDLYAIHFFDENNGFAVGDNNAILKTIDGGTTWSLITGPTAEAAADVRALKMVSKNRVWLGYSDGTLWYTHDGGTNWHQRQGWTGDATGDIAGMDWYSEYIGAFIHNDGSGVGWIQFTVDGGYDWERITTPTNAGLNAVAFVSPTELWAVGDPYSGHAMVVKVTGG